MSARCGILRATETVGKADAFVTMANGNTAISSSSSCLIYRHLLSPFSVVSLLEHSFAVIHLVVTFIQADFTSCHFNIRLKSKFLES